MPQNDKGISHDLVIVIPCYNEAERLESARFVEFLNNTDGVSVCFVNDGSKDSTLELLMSVNKELTDKVHVVTHEKNVGKAESVRRGALYCIENISPRKIAYIDADLATSLHECLDVSKSINNDVVFSFGSRIMKIGSTIERSPVRHVIGRVVATMISRVLNLKVYDTQCGCKVIRSDVASTLFKEPFISKWLFDVELFARLIKVYGRPDCLSKMIEIPLIRWTDKSGSKVKVTYMFRLCYDLLAINRKYRGVRKLVN